MAWERSFEARILKIRDKELKLQKLNYIIEVRLPPTAHPKPKIIVVCFKLDIVERYMVTSSLLIIFFVCLIRLR